MLLCFFVSSRGSKARPYIQRLKPLVLRPFFIKALRLEPIFTAGYMTLLEACPNPQGHAQKKPSVDGLCAPAAARGAQEVSCRRARVGALDFCLALELPADAHRRAGERPRNQHARTSGTRRRELPAKGASANAGDGSHPQETVSPPEGRRPKRQLADGARNLRIFSTAFL